MRKGRGHIYAPAAFYPLTNSELHKVGKWTGLAKSLKPTVRYGRGMFTT